MNYKRFLGAASAALMIIIAILMLPPGAGAASKYKTLYKFTGGKGGEFPGASLIFDQAGNLYGTTPDGGAHGGGIVFKLAPNADGSWRESVLHSFCSRTNCGDGEFPEASLIFDQAGNLLRHDVHWWRRSRCRYCLQAGTERGRQLEGKRAV